ncbi:MAG: autotransporter-associated beta strand repeat-containing protein [Verrucomicrobia bacterium]|nr:autotransporter-associated beta strand repeat-containing protein [Verrucomicrobiota bacterium]
MKTLRQHRQLIGWFMTCLMATWLPGPVVQGATFTWTPTGAGPLTWNSGANWTGGVPANAAGDIINLTANLAAAQTINLDVNATTGTINIGDPATGFFGYTLQSGNGSTLTFDNGALAAVLSKAAVATANDLISTEIILASTDNANFNITNAVANTTSLLTLSGNISESGVVKNLIIAGAAAASSNGVTVLSGTNSFTGTVTVNSGTLRAQGAEALNSGAVNDIALAAGSTLDLRANGNGLGNRENLVFGDNLALTGSATVLVDRTGSAGFPGSTALNKMIQLGNLNTGGANILTVTPANGYGLEFTGLTTLGGNSTFSVGGTQASNVVQGLTLSGIVDGAFTLAKTGTGTLVLGNSGNTFTGNISVTGGTLAFGSDGALGNAANTLTVNGTTTAIRAIGTVPFSSARSLSFANATAANNLFEVIGGQTFTLTGANAITNAVGFVKADNGTVAISASQNFAGSALINAGAINISDANALGTTAGATTVGNFVGAALQLSGAGITYAAEPLTLNSTGINTGGALQNLSGNNTWTGPITLASAATIGSDSGTLTLGGATGIAGAFGLTFAGAGNTLISTALNANVTGLTKIGTGTTTLGVANSLFVSAITVNAGTFAINGAGILGGTGAVTVNPGATLSLDNGSTQLNNRLGGRPITLSGGNLNLIGPTASATTVTETLGAPTFARGQTTVTVTSTAGQGGTNLAFGAPNAAVSNAINNGTPPSGATVLFRGTNLGSTAGTGVSTIASTTTGFTFLGQAGAAGATNKGIIPWALVDPTVSGLGTSFATADAATGILRPLNTGTEMVSSLTVDTNVRMTTNPAAIDSRRLNSITLESGGAVTLKPLDVLTVQSGGILTKAGNGGISSGVLAYPAAGFPIYIHTVGLATDNTTITSLLQGGNGQGNGNISFVKAGDGILTLQPSSSVIPGVGGNIAGGQTVINQGTLRMNGGNNTLYFNNFLSLVGGTLDLNGNAQTSRLFTDAAVANAGGTITGGAGSTFVQNLDAANRNFSGTVTGSVAFQRTGPNTLTLFSDSTTTGDILISGGTTLMRDSARFTGTTNLGINYATLQVDNTTSTINDNNRFNDSAAINLRGGVLNYIGRPQMATSETFGTLDVLQAGSTINAQHGNVGISSSLLTFDSLNRAAGSGATINFGNFINAVGVGTLGAIGSNPNILFTSSPVLTNGIIGTWAITNYADYASYIPELGIGSMGQAGYTPYSASIASGNNLPNNISNTTADVAIAANTTIGALRLGTNATRNITFTNGTATGGTNVLNLAMGGLLRSNDNNGTNIGTAVNRGILTTGGTASSGNTELLVWGNQNTMVINSVIVDTMTAIGSGTATTSLTKSGGFTLSLSGANTYTGGTIVSQGTLRLDAIAGGTVVIPAATVPTDGLVINGGTVTMNQFGGQIAASNIVTLNGPGVLNLAGANTLAGLVFNNNGGGNTNPTVNTASGGSVLNGGAALGGTLTLNGGVTVTSSNPGSIATIAGRVDLGASNRDFNIAQTIWNGQNVSALQPALQTTAALLGTAGLTKTGDGVLALAAQNPYTGNTTVTAGTLAINVLGATAPGGVPVGARNSRLDLASGTFLNLNSFSGLFGSLIGDGTVTNSSSTAGTLFVGYDNTNSTFGGSFARFSAAAPNTLNVTKIGNGNLTLTGTSTSTGTQIAAQGALTYSGTGNSLFATNNVLDGGTLVLDNSGTNVNSRLGGQVDTATDSVNLTLNGGTFTILGNSGAPTTESLGRINTLTAGATTVATTAVTVDAASINNLVVGMGISGPGIAANTTITAINQATNTLTISSNAQATGTGLTFTAQGGILSLASGASTINLTPTSTQGTTLNAGTMAAVTSGSSLLLRGPNLGSTNGAGVGNLTFTGAAPAQIGGLPLAAGVTTAGSPNVTVTATAGLSPGMFVTGPGIPLGARVLSVTSGTVFVLDTNATLALTAQAYTAAGNLFQVIRPDVLIDSSLTGTGTAFGTYQGAAGPFSAGGSGFRALTAAEYAPFLNSGATTNVAMGYQHGGAFITGTTINSLTLNQYGGTLAAGPIPQNTALTVTSGGIIAQAGNVGISGGLLAFGTAPGFIYTKGDLNVSAGITGSGGVAKGDAGALNFNRPQFYTGATTVNNGTLKLNGGTNTLFVNAIGGTNNLQVNGGTVNLNGNNQAVATLGSASNLAGTGGTITNAGAQAILTITGGTATPANGAGFSGSINGNIDLVKTGNNTATFTNANTFSGTTTLRGGITTLIDSGTFANTTSVAASLGTALNLDNRGLVNNVTRLGVIPVSLTGATLGYFGGNGVDSVQNLGALTTNGGMSFVNSTIGSGGSALLNFTSLTRNTDSVVNFGGTNLGISLNAGNAQIKFGTAPTLTNNLIGGWAIVNGNEFASYLPGTGVGTLNQTGFPGYTGTTMPAASAPTGNYRLGAAVAVPVVTGYNINSLNVVGNFNATFTNVGDGLRLVSGGLLKSGDNANSIGAAADSGRISAGDLSAGVKELFITNNQNTLTVNSRIVDNGFAGASTRLVLSGPSGGAFVLTAPNTYTGGTVINTTTALSGTNAQVVLPSAGGITINNAALNYGAGQSGKIATGANFTLNGGAALNLWGNTSLNDFTFNHDGNAAGSLVRTASVTGADSTTVAGSTTLTVTNNGANGLVVGMPVTGTNIPAGTTIAAIVNSTTVTLSQPATAAATNTAVTFGSTLTLTGNITANTNTPNSSPSFSVSTSGRIDIGTANRNITVTGTANSPLGLTVPTMIGTTGGITKLGNSGLSLTGVNYYTGATALNAGTIFLGVNNTIPYASTFTMAGTSRLDLNAFDQVLSQLSGAGDITNNSGTAKTLTFGLNNANTAFNGRFLGYNDTVLGTLSVSKIGSGSFGLTGGVSTSTANFNIYGGAVTYSGNAQTAFTNNIVNQTGSLILDNTTTNVNNRLGGLLKNLTVAGGEFKIQGNAAGSSESLGTLTLPNGGGVITLVPGAGSTVLNFASIPALGGGGSYLVRGDSLGSTPGNGISNIFASSVAFSGGGNIAGLANISTRPDMVGDASSTGTGTGFLTYTAGSGFRLLGANETLGTINNMFTTTANLAKSANETFTTNSVATVTLESGGGLTGFNTGSILTVSSIGILAKTGNLGFSGGQINPGASSMFIHTLGNLTVDSYVLGTGITKDGTGNLSFNRPQYFSGFLNNNDGTTTLNSGAANTILVAPTATAVTTIDLTANAGTVDLNGQNQAFRNLASINNSLPGTGTLITSAGAARLTSTGGGNFGGVIGGAITFDRSGNNTTLLTSAQTYTGATNVRGGTLQLRDSATLASTAGLNLEFGAVNIDNAGTAFNSAPANLADRILAGNAISTRGGTITLTGIQGETVTETLGTVTVLGGLSTVTATPGNTGRAALTITNLVRASGSGSRVNFTGTNLGFPDIGSSQILLTNLNGATPTLSSNLLGGWATTNGTEFASWTAGKGVGPLNNAGYAGYTGTTITAGSNPTQNIRLAATAAIGTADTLNSLNLPGDFNLTFAAATNTLNIVSGGLLKSGNTGNTIGATADSGRLTAGGTASGISELFIMNNQNTLTVNSRIIDNGTGQTRLVIAGAGTTVLAAPNTYTGDTVINSATNLGGGAAVVVIPNPVAVGGNTLTINNAAVGMLVNGGQIGANNNLVINGGGTLTYFGANNSIAGSITLNNQGGTAGPTIAGTGFSLTNSTTITGSNTVTVSASAGLAVGQPITGTGIPIGATITGTPTGTTITISAPATVSATNTTVTIPTVLSPTGTITAVNDTFGTTPTISAALNLGAAARTIDVSGLSLNSLVLSGIIQGSGSITKTGAGALSLTSNNSTFTGGIALNAGGLIIGASDQFNAGIVAAGPLGLGTLSVASGLKLIGVNTTIFNPVTLASNNLIISGVSGNNLALNGAITFGAGTPTVTVESPVVVGTLGAKYTGSFTFTKEGPGILALSNIANDYNGTTQVNNGTLRSGNTNSLSRFSNVNLATGGTLDINGLATVTGSITGTGLVTNNSGTGATLATGFDNSSFTFSGRFGSANQTSGSFNLNKIGTGTMTIDSAAGTGTMGIGTFTTSLGTSVLSGAAGSTKFITYTVLEGGTLTLDNSGTNLNNRLGGTDFAIGSGLVRNITMQGGEFKIIGNAAAPTVETMNLGTVGALSVVSGGSVLTLDANAAQSLILNAGNIANLSGGGSLLIRGDNLGAAPGAGVASLFAPSFNQAIGGATGNGSNTISIRPDIIADTSATGLGTAFATYSAIGGVRPLAASELAPGLFRAIATNSNVAVNSSQLFGSVTVNSLTFSGATALNAINDEAILNIGSGGLLVLDASGTDFTGGLIQSGGNQLIVHQLDTVNTLNFNAQVLGSNGFIKTGAGAMSIDRQQFFTGGSQTTINNGLLTLNSGADNTLTVIPTNTTPTLQSVRVSGGTLDLNGRNQAISTLDSTSSLPGTGGIVTNSSVTAATLTASPGGTFAGTLTGNLAFTRFGNSTTTLTSNNTYSGATIIRGGAIALQDEGRLSGTSSITNLFGQLTLNDSGLYVVSNRVGATPISMQGGTLAYTGVQSAATVGTVTLTGGAGSGGANTISVTPATGTVLPSTLTIANLVRNAGTTVNFTGTNPGAGGTNNSQIILTQVNGGAITLDDGILGGWAVVNGTDFAGYLAPSGAAGGVGALGTPGTAYPTYSTALLTAGGSTDNINVTAASTTGVTNRTINSLRVNSGAATTIDITAANTLTLGTGGLLMAANQTLAVNGGSLTSGGSELFAYINANTTTVASVINGGSVALVKSGAGGLTLTGNNTYGGGTIVNQGTLTLSTASANGGSTVSIPSGTLTINNAAVTQTVAGTIHASAPVVINGGAVLTLTGNNTFNGLITFNNTGGVTGGVQAASLVNSTTVNASPTITVSSTAGLWAGQTVSGTNIPAGSIITNIVSATQFTISANATGAATTVTVTVNNVAPTISTGGTLTLGNNVNSTNDSFSHTPTIGGTLALGGATRTITTGGLSSNSLNIPAIITGAGASNVLNLAGTGSVVLAGANTFGAIGSTSVNLQGGSLIFGADSTPSTVGAVITASPVGLGNLVITDGAKILAAGAARVIANNITANTQLISGISAQNLTLNGIITFGTANPTINVENNIAGNGGITTTLGAAFASGGGFNTFTKTGAGQLVISAPSNPNLTAPITINDGWLTTTTQYGLGGSNYTAGPALNFNGGSYLNGATNVFVQNAVNFGANGILHASVGNSAIGPVTMAAGSTALGTQGGQTTTIFGALTMNGTTASTLNTFNQLNVLGTLAGSTPSITKQGTANLILGGASTYAGNIIVDQGVLEARVGSSTPANEQLTSAGTITVNPGAALRVLSAANIGATATTVNTNNDGIGAIGLGYNGALPGSVTFATTSGTVDGTLAIDVLGYSTAVDLGALGPNNRVFLGSSASTGGNNASYTATTLGVGAGSTYRLGTGGGLLNINAPVLTGANSVIVGAVSGTPGANLIGNGGTVILNTPNTFTLGTTLNGNAVVQVGNAGALGSGTISFNSGTLQSNQSGIGNAVNNVTLLPAMSIANAINFTGTGVLSALAGSGNTIGAFAADGFIGSGFGQADLSFSGGVNLAGATYRSLSVADATRIVTLSGVVSGASTLVKTGVGILRLSNAANTYTNTAISQGILALSATGNLPGNILLNSGTLAGWDRNFTVTNDMQLIQSSTIDVGAATTTTASGIISGDFTYIGAQTGLTKTGLGTLVLSNANTYLGATTLNAGVLSISADNNLGSTGGLNVTPGGLAFNGGQLAVTASQTSNRVITMTAAGSIYAAAGQTYTNNALTANSTGLLTINGPGTVILNGNQTGANLHDNTAISNGATLLTQATTGTPFGDTAVTINGGSLRVNTNGPGAAFTIPTVNFAGGSYMRLDAMMGNDIQLTATTLARVGAGTLAIVPGADGNLGNTVGADARVLAGTILGQVTTTPQQLATLNNIGGFTGNNVNANAGSILRLASSTDQSASFVTYDPVLGFVSANPASPLTNTFAGSTSATIANITSATSITGTADVFGLTTTAGINGGTLRLRAMNTNDMGALIFNDTSTIGSNVVFNGLAPTVSLTGASTNTTTTVTVQTTAGLVVGQPISGPGIPLGATIATIASGTSITISAAATATASNVTLAVNPAVAAQASEGIIYVSGNTGVVGTISGGITGRTLTKTGAGTLALTGSNGIYGALTVNNGILRLGSSATTEQTTALVLNDTGTLDLNGSNATFASLAGTAGVITNSSATPGTLTVSGITGTTFLGNIVNGTGTTALVKNGTSTLTLGNITANNIFAGQNSFTGGVTLNQGILIAQDPLALGGANGSTPGTVTLQGGELRLNSNGGGPNGTILFGNPASNGLNLAVAGYATVNVNRVSANTGNQIQVGNFSVANNTLILTGDNSYSLKVAGTTSLGGAYANFTTTTRAPTYLDLAGPITGAGALNKLGGDAYGTVRISGSGNTYTGGTNIQTGALQVTTTASGALGTGPVSVNFGAALRIAGNGSLGGVTNLNLNSNVNSLPALVLDTDYNPGTALNSIIKLNGGFGASLQLAVPEFNTPLNMASFGDGTSFLGGYGSNEIRYIAPTLGVGAANTYRLGGNNGPSLAFTGTNNVLTGTARVIVGSQLANLSGAAITNGSGTVIFRNSNDYSGGTTISKVSTVTLDTGSTATPLGSGTVEVFGTLALGNPGGLNSPSFYNSNTNANSNVIQLRPGGTLTIQDQLGAVADGQGRWADATGQDINGGVFRYVGVANAQSFEQVGTLTASKGSTIQVNRPAGAGSVTLSAGGLTRGTNGTLLINDGSLALVGAAGTAQTSAMGIINNGSTLSPTSFARLVVSGVAPARAGTTLLGSGITAGGIVAPWVIDAQNNTFVTYSPTNTLGVVNSGFQSLLSNQAASTNGAAVAPGSGQLGYSHVYNVAAGTISVDPGAGSVIDIAAAETLGVNINTYAARISGNVSPTAAFNTITFAGGDTAFGGLLFTGTPTISPVQTAAATVTPVTLPMTLAYGAREATIYTGGNAIINAQITGTGGLTKFGGSNLTITSSNPGLTGNITVNQGTLILQNPVSNSGTAIASATNSQNIILNGHTGVGSILVIDSFLSNNSSMRIPASRATIRPSCSGSTI